MLFAPILGRLLLESALRTISIVRFSLLPLVISLAVGGWFVSTDVENHSPTVWWKGQEGRKPQRIWQDVVLIEQIKLGGIGESRSGTGPRPKGGRGLVRRAGAATILM